MSPAASQALRGARYASPFLIVVAPFAMLFGVVATEAGLSLLEVMGFSILVVGGASQFTALQLMTEGAPTLLVINAALVVNLRMAMYSAALAPHLGDLPFWQRLAVGYLNFDQSFVVATSEYDRAPDMPLSEKAGYFFGVALPTGATWWAFTLVGALVGNAIPESFALDFAVPIAFLALVRPPFRSLAHVAAAFTSVVVALALSWMPSGLGLIAAALAAMAVGAESRAADGPLMIADGYSIWGVIALLGLGTFLIRFSFLGLIGRRKLPNWLLRHLRYTPWPCCPV